MTMDESLAAAMLELYIEHAPTKPELAAKFPATDEFREALKLSVDALREVDEWHRLKRCVELTRHEPDWMINEHIAAFRAFLDARARYKAGKPRLPGQRSLAQDIKRALGMSVLLLVPFIASCVVYEPIHSSGKPVEIVPICSITIDYVHDASVQMGDCGDRDE
jgi:hypothetical protein